VTAVFVLLWLIASSVWGDAVSKIKMYTNPKEYFHEEDACECVSSSDSTECTRALECSVTNGGNYATINVSVVSTADWMLLLVA